MKFSSILSSVLALGAVAYAAESTESSTGSDSNKQILSVDVQFPNEYVKEYGVELVNDVETPIKVILKNQMAEQDGVPIVIAAIGGAVYEKENPDKIYTNLTITKIGPFSVQPGEEKLIEHSLKFNLPPKEFKLGFQFYIQHGDEFFSFNLNEKMNLFIVDPPISSFDPRLILVQLIAGATFGLIGYYLSTTYLLPFFDKYTEKKTTSTPGADSKRSPTPAEKTPEPASASGYDESWIPEHHLKSRSKK